MEPRPPLSLADQLAAAQDWWRDAGVDYAFADEAHGWLAEIAAAQAEPARPAPAPRQAVAEPSASPPPPQFTASAMPGDLAGFREWWVDPANPLPCGLHPRIAPAGAAGAALMVITPMPEERDGDVLLSGPQGRLIGNIARALGLAGDQAYRATALPAHLPMPDWEGLAAQGLGAVLAHHIALVVPARVLLLGGALPGLFGQSGDAMREIGGVPALASYAPDQLLGHPRQLARLWQRLLEWTA